MTQDERLLMYLTTNTGIDPLTAWKELGIYRLAATVHVLRKQGWVINTERMKVLNRFNEKCNVAFYKLEEVDGSI